MKVITILQPYATLIALGEKHIETRGWKADFLGPLLIHAGKSPAMVSECYQEPIKSILLKHGITSPSKMLFGYALAVTKLVSFTRSEVLVKTISATERHLGNYVPGRWGWGLKGTRRLDTAFQLRGAQGLFDWEPPAGFVWKFRDPDPEAPPETGAEQMARHESTMKELHRQSTQHGRKMTGNSTHG